MAHKYMIRISLVFAALVLSACGKGSNVSQETRTARGVTVNMSATCSNGKNAIGYIYDESSTQVSSFRSLVGELVSARFDPQYLGEVSGEPFAATGIDLQLFLRPAGNGRVASGQLRLTIYDSYVNMIGTDGQPIPPIEITMSQFDPSSVLSGTGFDVVFGDDLGKIKLTTDTGLDSQGNVSGTVQFQNNAGNGSHDPITLGRFKLPACAVQ